MATRLQFRIGTLLILVVLSASILGAYLIGYRSGYGFGYKSGLRERFSDEYVTRVYDIEDLVIPASLKSAPAKVRNANADLDSLIEIITSQVRPEMWDCGNPEIHNDSLGLVVYQTPAVHAEVQDLLDSLRKQKRTFELRRHSPVGSFGVSPSEAISR